MNLRNVAIIAHVDHGKTTLVDRLLQQSGTFRENQQVGRARHGLQRSGARARHHDPGQEHASVQWKDTRINIIDTPGHADFGGEVERILNMVDGALVLVDAAEGPMPQTKFVLSKALEGRLEADRRHQQDRPARRAADRSASTKCSICSPPSMRAKSSSTFRILYGSAKQGWMAESPEGPKDKGMQPLFDLIERHVAAPTVEDGPFRMIGTILEANPYLGRIITGRITSGTIKPNQTVKVLGGDGKLIENGRITKIIAFRGIERTPLEEAEAGDIVAIAGPHQGHGRRHLLRSQHRHALEGATDRSADGVDVVHRQQLPARRHRRRQGDEPHDPRPPAPGSRRQRGAARHRGRRQGFHGSVGPRRIAARDPDRDHAARGL